MDTKAARESLGEYIALNRAKKGLSQRKFAQLTGLSNTTVSRIEKGETLHPDAETIKIIAGFLDLDEADLLARASSTDVSSAQNEKLLFQQSMVKGMRLVTLRLKKNITQKQLGDAIGLEKTVISQLEGELCKADYSVLKRIADFFNVTVNYLTGTDDKLEAVPDTQSEANVPDLSTAGAIEALSGIKDENAADEEPKKTPAQEYLALAMELQQKQIDPEDIRKLLSIILKYKEK